jgi:hypothetical protein
MKEVTRGRGGEATCMEAARLARDTARANEQKKNLPARDVNEWMGKIENYDF